MKISRKSFVTSLGLGVVASAACGTEFSGAVATTSVGSSKSGHLTAYLQTPGQERALLAGGWLAGKVGLAIIEPFFALSAKETDHTCLADMKAANPGCTFLAYVNGSMLRPWDDSSLGNFFTTVDYNIGLKSGWVARDASGQVISYEDYKGTGVADLTNTSYRDALLARCEAILTTASVSTFGAPSSYFDGIFFDDVNMSPQHGLDVLNGFGPYPSNAAYGAAMVEAVSDVAGRLRSKDSSRRIVCNVGIVSSERNNSLVRDVDDASLKALALSLSAKRFSGGALFDGFLREFTTSYNPGPKMDMNPVDIKPVLKYSDSLGSNGVRLYLNDYAPPAARPEATPTPDEQKDWDRRQRLLGGMSLVIGPYVSAGAVVTVPSGRNQWGNSDYAQNMEDAVGSLTSSMMQRLVTGDPGNATAGPTQISGNLLIRKLKAGTVCVNIGTDSVVYQGNSIPAKDAIVVS